MLFRSALVLWIGIYPAPFLDVIHASVANLLQHYEAAAAAHAAALAAN